MRHDVMMAMSKSELDAYATSLGINVAAKKTIASKVAAIEDARGRCADIDVFGETFTIPIKAVHDKRVSDLATKSNLTDDDAMHLLELLLGEEQIAKLTELCTDEDGTVDVNAIALAMATILQSEKLKNF